MRYPKHPLNETMEFQDSYRLTRDHIDECTLFIITALNELTRVIIFDAGGLSTDVSILEFNSGKYRKLSASKSFIKCGGEQLSSQIGRKENGTKGTKYKETLARKYLKGVADKKLQEYQYQTAVIASYL